ncbi:hypothetical protein [Kosakonia cowanii]|uniref:hypothetical protein n=1 Tax=Kosakonia cowanii TaxID=208223 RepID=UPI003B21D03E
MPCNTTELIGFVVAKVEVLSGLIADTDIDFGARKKLILFNKRESNTTFGDNFRSFENIFHRHGCRKVIIKFMILIKLQINDICLKISAVLFGFCIVGLALPVSYADINEISTTPPVMIQPNFGPKVDKNSIMIVLFLRD